MLHPAPATARASPESLSLGWRAAQPCLTLPSCLQELPGLCLDSPSPVLAHFAPGSTAKLCRGQVPAQADFYPTAGPFKASLHSLHCHRGARLDPFLHPLLHPSGISTQEMKEQSTSGTFFNVQIAQKEVAALLCPKPSRRRTPELGLGGGTAGKAAELALGAL